tara:strand:- start:239 stop:913 length:675 start_codon:yes stop_codon:yes gene_type:complete
MLTLVKLCDLIDIHTNDLRELAQTLGCDPATFYIGTDLAGVGIRGQDLRGMKFDHTNLTEAHLDLTTKFDPEVERALRHVTKKRYLEVSTELFDYVDLFFSKSRFRSRGWFIKAIVPNAAIEISKRLYYWQNVIDESDEFRNFFNATERSRTDLLLNVYDYKAGLELGKMYGGYGSGLTALIIVGILSLVYPDNTKIEENLTLSSVFQDFKNDRRLKQMYLKEK